MSCNRSPWRVNGFIRPKSWPRCRHPSARNLNFYGCLPRSHGVPLNGNLRLESQMMGSHACASALAELFSSNGVFLVISQGVSPSEQASAEIHVVRRLRLQRRAPATIQMNAALHVTEWLTMVPRSFLVSPRIGATAQDRSASPPLDFQVSHVRELPGPFDSVCRGPAAVCSIV